ncbi:urea ABC transporter permease subunit UrtB [Desulfosediminicola flagellatus]|uniref:urea ABC transporter permease subunit UrtB n=1 Tax=Desulfosediminicola flagellatus TaxID=2569541 RepID=UPI0010AD1E39|nr:urea ABC transporter permease subunit UrtB [Desulfosediminicola flagellatus]
MNSSLRHCSIALVASLLLIFSSLYSVAAQSSLFSEGIALLSSKKFDDKEKGITSIGESGDPLAEQTLLALLNGNLFFTKSDRTLVYGTPEDKQYAISDLLTGKSLGLIKKRKLAKITINNQIRGTLKSTLAQINLTHPDKDKRLAAATAILYDATPDILPILTECYRTEQDAAVKDVLATALALAGLQHPEPQKRLAALDTLQNTMDPVVKNALQTLLEKEQDPAVQKAAGTILTEIERTIAWYAKLETIFFGLSLGSVLVLAAIGLAITFGVIGVINMAHGELIMLGAYTTYVLQQLMPNSIGFALALSVPAAFCVSGLVGIVIEKSVIRFLYGRPLETLLATFGISLVLQQTVRSIFSPLNRSVSTPEWMSGSIAINPILSLTTNRVTIFIFAMIVFAALYLLLKKSSLGLHVRAVAQNRAMARAMGVRAARVDALTFGLGSGIAGIAGVALSQLTNVGPNLGQAYIIDSFMVVVFGGVGNLWGTLLGGLSLGIANKILEPWSGAVLAKILILVFIILFIQKRPQGLFPQKGRAAE